MWGVSKRGLGVALLSVLLAACSFEIAKNGDFSCPDGVCPLGFACVEGLCQAEESPRGDGGATVDADPAAPDGAPSTCGNGSIEGSEACDLGLANANDGACLTSCQVATCGDGFIRTGVEECDPEVSGARCTSGCLLCPSPSHASFEGRCFGIGVTDSWVLGWLTCSDTPGEHFASLTSSAEQAQVAALVMASGSLAPVWIGLPSTNGWMNGEPLGFTAWAPGEPSAPVDFNVAMTVTSNGDATWSTLDTNTGLRAICERVPALLFPADGRAFKTFYTGYYADVAASKCTRLALLDSPALGAFLGAQLPAGEDAYCVRTPAQACRVARRVGGVLVVQDACTDQVGCRPLCELP